MWYAEDHIYSAGSTVFPKNAGAACCPRTPESGTIAFCNIDSRRPEESYLKLNAIEKTQ